MRDGVGEELLGRGRLAVHPAQMAHSIEQQRLFARIGDVGENALEEMARLPECDCALGFVRGAETRDDGLVGPAGSEEVAGDGDCASVLGEERIGSAGMDSLALRQDRVARDRLLGEGVAPAVAVARLRALVEKLLRNGGLEGFQHDSLVESRNVHEQAVVERPAEDGGRPQHLDLLCVEPAETEEHRLAHGLRKAERLGRVSLPAGLRLDDLAAVERLTQHLLEHERVTLGTRVDEVRELGAHVVGVEDRRDHLGHVALRHRRHRDRLRQPRSPPGLHRAGQRMAPVDLVASIGGEQHHAALDEAPRGVVEELARRAVRPVDVVEHEEQSAIARPQLEQRHDRLEEPQLGLGGIAGGCRRGAGRELRKQLCQLLGRRPELGSYVGRVPFAEVVSDRFDERQERKDELGIRAAAPQDVAAELPRAFAQLRRETGLSDSRLAGEQDETAVASIHRQQRVLEFGQLVLAPDEHGGEDPVQHPPIVSGGQWHPAEPATFSSDPARRAVRR